MATQSINSSFQYLRIELDINYFEEINASFNFKIPILLVENTMEIVWRNDASRESFFLNLLDFGASDAYVCRMANDIADRQLRALVRRVFERGGSESLALGDPCGMGAVRVTCSRRSFVRLGAHGGHFQCERMLLVWRAGVAEDLNGGLRRPSLSVVEARLVRHLADGKTVRQASELMHISYHTGRKYLQTIFAKTGARRQAELVALFTSDRILSSRDRQPPLL